MVDCVNNVDVHYFCYYGESWMMDVILAINIVLVDK
jgi:hypothetical protein